MDWLDDINAAGSRILDDRLQKFIVQLTGHRLEDRRFQQFFVAALL